MLSSEAFTAEAAVRRALSVLERPGYFFAYRISIEALVLPILFFKIPHSDYTKIEHKPCSLVCSLIAFWDARGLRRLEVQVPVGGIFQSCLRFGVWGLWFEGLEFRAV